MIVAANDGNRRLQSIAVGSIPVITGPWDAPSVFCMVEIPPFILLDRQDGFFVFMTAPPLKTSLTCRNIPILLSKETPA